MCLGEPGLDAGGVAREFYTLLCQSIFNPNCGLFLYSSVNQMCVQINPNSAILLGIPSFVATVVNVFRRGESSSLFSNSRKDFRLERSCNDRLLSCNLGKAVMDNQITPVHLVQPLYKHIMGWPMTLRDLEHIDEDIFRNLMRLLEIDDIRLFHV